MKKKVLITVYDMEIGGIERSLVNMMKRFDYDKYDIDLLICNHTGEFIRLIPPQVNILNEIIEYANFRRHIVQGIKGKQYAISVIRIVSKVLARGKMILHGVKEEGGWYYLQMALKYSRPFLPRIKKKYDAAISYAWPHDIVAKKVDAEKKIAWIHTDYSKLPIDNKIDYKIWNKFDNIMSVSEECSKAFIKVYPELTNKIVLMENITSPDFIKAMSEKAMDGELYGRNTFNILSVGRLSYAKGFDNAVRALKLLHDRGYTSIRWYIVGYGGDEYMLRGLIKTCKLDGSFILLGKKLNPYPYMKHCDLYVQPSRYEGKAITVTEAQILGRPVLITDYPTARSQIKHGINGYITDLSVEGIADGIEKLYKNREIRKVLSDNCCADDYCNSDEMKKLYSLLY